MENKDIIHYTCKCGEDNSMIAKFAYYMLEYIKENPHFIPSCRNCGVEVPVKKLYNKHIKEVKHEVKTH